jgi:hypothetical protein
MRRPKDIENPVRRMVSLSAETAKAIEDYRFKHRITTESEAIRHLIEAGLERFTSKLGNPSA